MISKNLLNTLLAFRQERDWEKFHTVRNLISALCVESAELLDLFRWASDAEITSILKECSSEIESELADVAILLSYLCHDLNISIEDAMRKKIEINREKYPIEKAKGTARKYNKLSK
jgi:dCTP diphosphatase